MANVTGHASGVIPGSPAEISARRVRRSRILCNHQAAEGRLCILNRRNRRSESGNNVPEARFKASSGSDPLFRLIDGATCSTAAATLREVVNFYDQRFGIGFSNGQNEDLVNFLNAL
jgi:hypothetical protein